MSSLLLAGNVLVYEMVIDLTKTNDALYISIETNDESNAFGVMPTVSC